MRETILSSFLLLLLHGSFAQTGRFEAFLSDPAMTNASVSFLVAGADSGNVLISYNPRISLIPASTLKLVTSAAALELLGPEYTFKTIIGYTGYLNRRSGRLDGNIVIRGGGDPSLGSEYFSDHYREFIWSWVEEIKKSGIKKIRGKIVTDDSYYDFEPVPPRWLWEDLGTYFGAGVYGLSVFDNTHRIKVRSSPDSSRVEITGIKPDIKDYRFINNLTASGEGDNWYVFAAPYSREGWLSGTIPVSNEEYIIEASISDPPLLIAKILHENLVKEAVEISGEPSTKRLEPGIMTGDFTYITETLSPYLSVITDVLNKESVNLYAEHLVKELGKHYANIGSTAAGVKILYDFLQSTGADTTGLFIEDGSGLSARNGINSEGLVKLLIYMRNRGKHFDLFYSSLPDAGKNGTLAKYFTDPVFESNLKAKSGSMTRVRCYAGYFNSRSGKPLVFCILVNNYQGTSGCIINYIEEILKEIIIYN
jgi:D-alanyl-D-alanine carboxypeptidase/D-alanyl-D-alanine-endopeptidase (penicillin-binding protein 4)